MLEFPSTARLIFVQSGNKKREPALINRSNVYWREKKDGVWTTHLLAGKARVTPLKPVSIPRLELQAALLGTRLAQSVLEELDVVPKRRTYWTDSSTVLAWIRSDPRTFKPFVAHRLAGIEDTSRPDEWRWVPTSQNPADDATRSTPKNFTARHRWFTGPDFLAKEEDKWPEHRRFKTSITGEEKETKHLVAVVSPSSLPTPDPVRFSRWVRLLRATARVLQFVHLCRKEKALRARSSDPVCARRSNEGLPRPRRANTRGGHTHLHWPSERAEFKNYKAGEPAYHGKQDHRTATRWSRAASRRRSRRWCEARGGGCRRRS
ncbi:unnamed protein product [Danaus chrysippus]|uniref:(African queen) hypothetical protein n=1 Tax=Danaus chrysippus TaxID=151541 RepID=A0A8J2QVJ3_9NEOP|nr:unnamed protein product [Danaus chrysippus]